MSGWWLAERDGRRTAGPMSGWRASRPMSGWRAFRAMSGWRASRPQLGQRASCPLRPRQARPLPFRPARRAGPTGRRSRGDRPTGPKSQSPPTFVVCHLSFVLLVASPKGTTFGEAALSPLHDDAGRDKRGPSRYPLPPRARVPWRRLRVERRGVARVTGAGEVGVSSSHVSRLASYHLAFVSLVR